MKQSQQQSRLPYPLVEVQQDKPAVAPPAPQAPAVPALQETVSQVSPQQQQAYQQQTQAQQHAQFAQAQQAYQQQAHAQQAQQQALLQQQARLEQMRVEQAQQQARLQAQHDHIKQVQYQQQAQAQRLQAQQAEVAAAQRAMANAQAELRAAQAQQGYPAAAQPAPVITVQQAPKRHGWIVVLVLVLCLCGLGAFGLYSCQGKFGVAGPVLSDNTIAVIDIDGTIQYDGSACSPEGLGSLLSYAESTDAFKAVVLRVNSGGGTATAGEEMAELVKKFSKPVVVSSASLNASAAYEISSQANYIYVAKTTEIGSIGTYIQVTDYSGLMGMLGINVDTIASAESKGAAAGYRALTESERAYYQHMVDQINNVFIQNVAAGRGMPVEAVRKLATGMVYTGIDAVENGLADSFGGREDALNKAAELAGLDTYSVYELGFASSSLGLLDSLLTSEQANELALEKLTERYGTPTAN